MAITGWKDTEYTRRKSRYTQILLEASFIPFKIQIPFPPLSNFEITDIRHARQKRQGEKSPRLILMLIPFRFVRSYIFIRIFRKGTGHDRAETIVHEADFMAFQSVKRGKYINGGLDEGVWK